MKWIGKNISLDASLADITSVVAGTGISGGGTTGDVTLNMDLSELNVVALASGDWFATLDSDASTHQRTTIAGLATHLSGVGLTADGSGAINVDAAQGQITSVGILSDGTWNATQIETEYIANDAITEDKLANSLLAEIDANTAKIVPPNIYDSTIKLIPSDFVSNDDGGNTKFGIGYVDAAGSGYGMRPANSLTELFAFVSIPQGMKATHVNIFAKSTYATAVFEVQINANTMSALETGSCNTNLAITNVDSTAYNVLAISVDTTATTDKVFGGIVTIAAI